jgi:hypothetical protein
MVSDLALRAKDIYLEMVDLDPNFNLKKFASRSVELLGKSVSYSRVKHWSADHGWEEAASQLRRALEVDRVLFFMDLAYGQAVGATNAKDVASFTKSYLNSLTNMPESFVVEEEGRIRDLKDAIYNATREGDVEIPSGVLSALTSAYTQLNQRLSTDSTMTREPGIDVDGWLLDVADGEALTAVPQRRLTPNQFEEFKKCKKDAVHFITKYGWLKHTSRGAIRWDKPYPYQVEMWQALQNGDNIITKKSRQIGCSWATSAFICWLVVFHPDIECIILSKSELYAIKFLEKVKFFFNRLPRWMQPIVSTSAQGKFSVKFMAGTGEVGNSDVYSLTTTTDSGRSFSARFVAMDEAAFLPNGEETWGSVKPTTSHGGQVAVISTPNGVGDFYHRLWIQTEMGEDTGYTPIIAYYKDCGFDDKWLKKATAGMTIQQILQEYELQFISAHSPFFDLTQLADCYYPADEFPEILDSKGNNIKIKTHMSFSGADTSNGRATAHGEPDYHSIVTLNEYGIQIAAHHDNKTGIDKFAGYTLTLENGEKVEVEGVTTQWHREYPGAMIIETFGSGDTTFSRHEIPFDDRSYAIPRKTTGGQHGVGSKLRLLNDLRLAFAGKQIIVTDYFTYVCLQAYEDLGYGKSGAAQGMFDDPVIALALAYSALKGWGGMVFDIPGEVASGQRIVALKREQDLSPDDLRDVLTVGEITQGPMWDGPGERLSDGVENLRTARVRESEVW